MVDHITMQPRLYAEAEPKLADNEETQARIARLRSFQDRIARKPDVYLHAFEELGEGATDEVLDIHNDATLTRSASRSPKEHIKEYFAKRDDIELRFDEESDEAIFATKAVMEAIARSKEKRAILKRKGVMGSTLEENPAARSASNASRREIFGAYLSRVVSWDGQQAEKQNGQRAG